MIGSKKRSERVANNNVDNGINRIVEGTEIEGLIRCESNLRIDGVFKGELITKGRLVVGPKGRVSGVVNCLCCDVEGILEGEVTVLELLAMKASATVQGELYYGQLSVEAGAKALGTFRMGVADEKPKNKFAEKTASRDVAMASLKSSTMPSEVNQKQKVGTGA